MIELSLATNFDQFSYLIGWSADTGLLGVSLWVLVGNVLFYYVFIRDNAIFQGKIRWLSLVYSIVLLILPVLISAT